MIYLADKDKPEYFQEVKIDGDKGEYKSKSKWKFKMPSEKLRSNKNETDKWLREWPLNKNAWLIFKLNNQPTQLF
jgi:hypothetical protein